MKAHRRLGRSRALPIARRPDGVSFAGAEIAQAASAPFRQAIAPQPTADLMATPASVPAGSSTAATWSDTPEPFVFVVDGDKAARKRLANLLKARACSVETFATAEEYLARAPHDGPACLVVDVQLPGLDGLAIQQRLAGLGRGEPIVFITGHEDFRAGIQAMKQGAVDFLLKPFGNEALLDAVAEGLARSATEWRERDERVKIRARLAALTPREFEVFRFVIAGLLNKQIAAELDAALRTVKRHRGCVMQKLGVVSVADLVRLAQKAGIPPASDGPKVPYTG